MSSRQTADQCASSIVHRSVHYIFAIIIPSRYADAAVVDAAAAAAADDDDYDGA